MDFDDLIAICRGCLANERKMVNATLYKTDFRDMTGITISPSDGLPQWLCYECIALLQKCVRFRKKLIYSHKKLMQYVKDSIPFACTRGVSSYFSTSNIQHYEIPGTETEQIVDLKDIVGADTDISLVSCETVKNKSVRCDYENNLTEEKCCEDNTLADVTMDSSASDDLKLDKVTLSHEEQTDQREMEEPVYVLHKTDRLKEEIQDGSLCSAYKDNNTIDQLSIEKKIELRCKSFLRNPHREKETQYVREKKQKQEDTTHTTSNKTKSKRTWDRKNACLYCGKLVTNFIRHIKMHHSKEKEVIDVFAINDLDLKVRKQKRQAITDSLRNRGNHSYNCKISNENEGQIIPSKRRSKNEIRSSSYVTCKTCLGTFKRSTFYKHLKKCKCTDGQNSHKKRVLNAESMPVTPELATVPHILKNSILKTLRNDEISLVIKNDPLILELGTRLLKKNKRNRKPICSKLRDLANLSLKLQKMDPSIRELKDVFDPEKYEVFMNAVKEMCEFNKDTGSVAIKSVPARIRPAVTGCIDILYTQTLMDPNVSKSDQENMKEKLDKFKDLLESNWQFKIS